MRTITELNILLRAQTKLPDGLNLATEEFNEDWNLVRTVTAQRLGKKIVTRGWNFIKIPDESLRCGVGDTSQEAIACALKLALCRVNAQYNAAEVERIGLVEYPWSFLARVKVNPYCIQQDAVPTVFDESFSVHCAPRQRRPPGKAGVLHPYLGSNKHQLKQMLALSRTVGAGPR